MKKIIFIPMIFAANLLLAQCSTNTKQTKDAKKYYDYIYIYSESLAAAKLNNKWGFIDATGTEITPFIYEDVKFS
jgi:hypothetical protein